MKWENFKSYICVSPGVEGFIMAGDEDGHHVHPLLLHSNALQHRSKLVIQGQGKTLESGHER